MTENQNLDSTDKLLCTLAYPIPLIGVILIATKKEIQDCKYHGFNSVFFGVAGFVAFTILGILGSILANIPALGCLVGVVWSAIMGLLGLGYFIYSIFLALETHNGKYPVIPIVTDFAKKYMG